MIIPSFVKSWCTTVMLEVRADSTGRRNTLIMEVFGNGDGRLE